MIDENNRKLGEYDEVFILNKAQEAYEKTENTIKINPKKTALILIDLTNAFVRPRWSRLWCPESTRQVPKIRELIENCRETGIPIIHSRWADRDPFDSNRPKKFNQMFPSGSLKMLDAVSKEANEFYPEVSPKPGEIIVFKHSYGAFHATELDMILRNLGIETVIIAGTMTNYCCGMTAREAQVRGYKVVFGSDINSTDLRQIHEAELKTLRRGFALVINCDEIIEAIKGRGPYSA
jgi:nicotinamidase-related amidase